MLDINVKASIPVASTLMLTASAQTQTGSSAHSDEPVFGDLSRFFLRLLSPLTPSRQTPSNIASQKASMRQKARVAVLIGMNTAFKPLYVVRRWLFGNASLLKITRVQLVRGADYQLVLGMTIESVIP